MCVDYPFAAAAGNGDFGARQTGQSRDLLSGAAGEGRENFQAPQVPQYEYGNLLPDEVRLTSFGRKLRALSIDELPELWDIFRGKMSIVGPRPLLVEYLPYYTAEERHRHDIRPGLTGLAQINGRNNLTWEQKFSYDLEYVQNISFRTDVCIIFNTISKVLHRSDIQVNTQYSEGNLAKLRSCADKTLELKV